MLEKYKVLRSAERYVYKGKYDNAIKEYRRLLEQEGDDPGVLNTFGDVLLKHGQREEALSTFLRVSDIYTESGFVTKAIAICKKVRQLKPADADASEKLAELYIRQGLHGQAAPLLLEAVEEHQEWGRVDDAVRNLERLLEFDETPPARRQMAVLCLQAEESDKAAGHFDRAAQLYGREGQSEEAEECREEARRLGLEPTEIESETVEAAAPVESAELEAEAETVQEGHDAVADQEPAAENGASGSLLLNNSGEPAATTATSSEIAGVEAAAGKDAFELVGNDLSAVASTPGGGFDLGDDDDFELVDNQDSTWDLVDDDHSAGLAMPSVEPWEGPIDDALEEADFYLKLGLQADARSVLTRLLQTFPDDERVLRRAEKARLPLPEKTAEPVVAVPQENGDSFEMEVDLALDVLFEGDGEEVAQEVLRYDVARNEKTHDENDPKVHYDLGLAYKEMGLTEDCIEKFKQAYELFEDKENAPRRVLCCSMLANAFLQLEDYVEVVDWARRGLDLPGKKEFEWKALQYDASQALEQLGKEEEALTGYRSISETDPNYRDVGSRVNALTLKLGHD